MQSILLKFAGPMQSYGTGSHFETRHTDLYPSKSAVVGMVAAALGYRRDETESIQQLNKLDFAVRVDQEGNLLRDFHVAQKYKKNGSFERTYVTNRYYLEDAIFVIGLGHQDSSWLENIEEALKNPYFQPYLGRRSLPLNPDFYLGMVEGTVIDALKSYPWQASDWYKSQNSPHAKIYFDAGLAKSSIKKVKKDQVISFSQKNRRFDNRFEGQIEVTFAEADIKAEHDAFSALGVDNDVSFES